MRRPKYKKLESTELIEQNTSSEQQFRHFNNSKLQKLYFIYILIITQYDINNISIQV